MRVVAIIQARMESSRLPGKVLKPIAGRPLLWHIVHRLRKSKMVDLICLAIPSTKANDELYQFALQQGIEVVRGPEDNVLKRYYMAALKTGADIVIRVNGDAPLIDPCWLDYLIETMIEEKVDLIEGDSQKPSIHQGFTPLTFNALQALVREAGSDPVAREHVTGYFKEHPGFVSTRAVAPLEEHQFKGARLSVDTPKDLKFMEAIHRELKAAAGEIDLADLVRLLHKKPDLLAINAHVYQKRADQKSRRVLIRCDGGARIGFGHLFRSLSLSNELRDRHGCGIDFVMAESKEGCELLRHEGYRVMEIGEKTEEEYLASIMAGINKPDLLIFDTLTEIDSSLLEKWKKSDILIVTIDDPTDKRLSADLAFYPPVPQVNEMNWQGFSGQLMTGWEWVVLRSQFAEKEAFKAEKAEEVPQVIVTMGGSDPKGFTMEAVKALDGLDLEAEILILLGHGFNSYDSLYKLLEKCRLTYKVIEGCSEPWKLFAGADLAVASFGVTAYELAALGVPAVLLSISEDHARSASVFGSSGIAVSLGLYTEQKRKSLALSVQELLSDRELRKKMGNKAVELVDGKGARRIAGLVMEIIA